MDLSTYAKLLHDNAPSHKAAIVTKFLEDEKITALPIHPIPQTWPMWLIPIPPDEADASW